MASATVSLDIIKDELKTQLINLELEGADTVSEIEFRFGYDNKLTPITVKYFGESPSGSKEGSAESILKKTLGDTPSIDISTFRKIINNYKDKAGFVESMLLKVNLASRAGYAFILDDIEAIKHFCMYDTLDDGSYLLQRKERLTRGDLDEFAAKLTISSESIIDNEEQIIAAKNNLNGRKKHFFRYLKRYSISNSLPDDLEGEVKLEMSVIRENMGVNVRDSGVISTNPDEHYEVELEISNIRYGQIVNISGESKTINDENFNSLWKKVLPHLTYILTVLQGGQVIDNVADIEETFNAYASLTNPHMRLASIRIPEINTVTWGYLDNAIRDRWHNLTNTDGNKVMKDFNTYDEKNLEDNLIGNIEPDTFEELVKDTARAITNRKSDRWGGRFKNSLFRFIGDQVDIVNHSKLQPFCSSDFSGWYDNHLITDKAHGDRRLLYINKLGHVYLISNSHNGVGLLSYVNRLKHIHPTGVTVNTEYADTILDGELMEDSGIVRFLAFDLVFLKAQDLRTTIFYDPEQFKKSAPDPELPCRYYSLKQVIEELKIDFPDTFNLYAKQFIEISKIRGNKDKMLRKLNKDYNFTIKAGGLDGLDNGYNLVMEKTLDSYKYELDGLIIQPLRYHYNQTPRTVIPGKVVGEHDKVLKWKPLLQITNDFLVKFVGKMQQSSDGSSTINVNLFAQGRDGELVKWYTGPLRSSFTFKVGKDKIVRTLDGNQAVRSGDIVECRWSNSQSTWLPVRLRNDKPQPNAEFTVRRNWDIIRKPISLYNLGDLNSYCAMYYHGKSSMVKMNNYHNWKKSEILKALPDKSSTLIDLGTGQLGDVSKWLHSDVMIAKDTEKGKIGILAVDNELIGFTNAERGAISRLKKRSRRNDISHIRLLLADISKPFTVPGQSSQTSTVTSDEAEYIGMVSDPRIEEVINKSYFQNATAFFALHYMNESNESLHNFFINVSKNLKEGGIFTGTTTSVSGFNAIFAAAEDVKSSKKRTLYVNDDSNVVIAVQRSGKDVTSLYKIRSFESDGKVIAFEVNQGSFKRKEFPFDTDSTDNKLGTWKYAVNVAAKYGLTLVGDIEHFEKPTDEILESDSANSFNLGELSTEEELFSKTNFVFKFKRTSEAVNYDQEIPPGILTVNDNTSEDPDVQFKEEGPTKPSKSSKSSKAKSAAGEPETAAGSKKKTDIKKKKKKKKEKGKKEKGKKEKKE